MVFPRPIKIQTGERTQQRANNTPPPPRRVGILGQTIQSGATPIFSTVVERAALNPFGVAYGGHLFSWHLLAAATAARAQICRFFSTSTIRVERGHVDFRAPTYLGQEVFAYITSSTLSPSSANDPLSVRATYGVTLASSPAPHALHEAPESLRPVGHSTIQLLVTPPLHDPLLARPAPDGLPVTALMQGISHPAEATPWTAVDHAEALLRRSMQLATVADFRLWDQAFAELKGAVAPETLKTRSLTIEFFNALAGVESSEGAYRYNAEGTYRQTRSGRFPLIVAQASVTNSANVPLMRAIAEMVETESRDQ